MKNVAISTQAFAGICVGSSTVELLPNLLVLGTPDISLVTKSALMLADDIVETITHSLQKVIISVDDGAVELELDHQLALPDRSQLAAEV